MLESPGLSAQVSRFSDPLASAHLSSGGTREWLNTRSGREDSATPMTLCCASPETLGLLGCGDLGK